MIKNADFRELRTELESRGLFEPRAWRASIKLLLLLTAFALVTATTILLPAWCAIFLVPLASILAVTAAMMGHDAAHGCFSRSKSVNSIVLHLVFPLFSGLGALFWKNKHNRLHHGGPNVVDKDIDLEMWPMAMSSLAYQRSGRFRRWFQRTHQGWMFWPLTTALGFTLRAASLQHLVVHLRRRGLDRAWLADASCLLGHYILWLAVPTLWFSPLSVLLFYVGLWLIGGLLLALIFAPAHMGMPIIANTATKGSPWLDQLETTRNLRLPRWVAWFFVGLDYQVEHHLFPRIPHQHLRHSNVIVRRWCARLGAPYHELGFSAAIVDVTRFMMTSWRYEPRERASLRAADVSSENPLEISRAGGLIPRA
ncbi:fatty acid desaturase family protein [Haliangium ochraceum]|uniref:Fatty acid desaturase n=1 Tax=Haliangium ochraceum (strain DSM 14365 / JCM 11303 / SMP-2) TaxID=502025 RepID=D0LQY2_HALO1|nr:acyl-CoA desaturase [Haliangium ochraceum]ACY15490.1 fatty acid desaturase [Haliangium ochraceum DSM 14365]